jgi:phage-related protein
MQDVLANAATGMLAPLKQAFGQIPSLLKGIAPELKAVFAGAGSLIEPLLHGITALAHDVLPGLASALHAVGPLLAPLLDGFGKLLGGILPGLTTLLKAAAPAIHALAGGLGQIGHGIGSMLGEFAPVVKASSTILKALLDVIAGIFPIVGKLAGIFASTLAPIFVTFAGIVKALLPFLTTIGNVFASLAGAVLNDLVSAFGALADLLKAVAPSLGTFAKAISGVFDVLENTGVFAILGDALEGIVKPLGAFISALVNGLAPILPPIIKFVGDISAQLATQLAQAIAAVLPPLTQLATIVLQAIAEVLPVILPLLTEFVNFFTSNLATVIEGVANGLSSLLKALPPSVLKGIVIAIGAVVAATKLWAVAMGVLDVALDANPISLIVIAIAALGAAFYAAWEKSAGFRTVIKDIGIALLDFGVIVVRANQVIIDSFLSMVGTILHGVADAFGWVPGLGPKLREASQNFDDFKAGVDNNINHMVNTMEGWKSELEGTTRQTQQNTGQWVDNFNNASQTIVSDLGKAGTSASTARGLIANLTTAIQQNGAQSSQAQGARQKLITDLENAGLSAKQATSLVNNLSTAVSGLHGKNININMNGKGVYIISQGPGSDPIIAGHAAGGPITRGSTGTADDVVIRASKGEYMVKQSSAAKYGSQAMDAVNNGTATIGYAQGGMIGPSGNLTGGYITGMYADFQKRFTDAMVAAMRKSLNDAISKATAAAVGAGSPGPGGGSAAANAALARKLYPPWATGPEWTAWNNVAMRESGWNNTITNGGRPYNPYNVAYGIPQALPAIKMGAAANPPQSNPTAQINWMIGYIKSVYGDPLGAWNNEVTQGFYDDGGWLRHGPMNRTRRPEAILTPAQSDSFMALAAGATQHGGADVIDRLDKLVGLMGSMIDTTAAVPSSLSRGFQSAFDDIGREASFRRRYPRGGA